ncbi:DUF4382 domain-containing protein [Candidatus Woesearchaeota archaeon]|nr:DUF4382 domain-containing protein [Candidatus Woesearchaeota archaeon]
MKRELLALLILLSVFVLAAGCVPPQQMEKEGAALQEMKGRVVFTITDAAVNMSAVTSLMVTVDSVQVHSAAEGWVIVSSKPQTFDLLKLKIQGSQELLADVTLNEGTYQQLRLNISKVVVTDAEGEHEAKLPSGELKIVGNLEVKANSTSTASFDFIADESLHVTGNGEYILAPVVKLETKEDAEVEVKADLKVEIKGGTVKTNVKVGMDADGNVGVGLGIPAKASLSIGQGRVKVDGGLALGKEKKEEDNTSIKAETQVKVGASY